MLYIPYPFKCCKECGNAFPPTDKFFYAQTHCKNGLRPRCKQCDAAKTSEWVKKNPEKFRKNVHAYKERNREQIRERERIRRAANPEKERARSKKYRLTHAEEKSRSNKAWSDKNKDKKRHYAAQRLAKQLELENTFTEQDWQIALDYFHGCCAYCGHTASLFDRALVLQKEHFIPVTQKGGYTPENIIPACQTCNTSKNNRHPEQWCVSHFGKKHGGLILERIEKYFEWRHEFTLKP